MLRNISASSTTSASTSTRYFGNTTTNLLLKNQQRYLAPSLNQSISRFSTKSESSSLVDFLKEEIEAEKKLGKQQLQGAQQPGIPGFQVKTDQREVTLTKQNGAEQITVTFDVNHTVDSDAMNETADPAKSTQEAQEESPSMVSKPSFTVEVAKGDQKLVFECAFVEPDYGEASQGTEDYADLFNIEEIYMYTGEFNEKNKIYAVSGGIIDGTLYDHLMNYLEERGIDNEFAENLTRFATFYEHGQYVSLLQKLRDFVSH
jgi:complement component 1 Q subcomponent-binding protein